MLELFPEGFEEIEQDGTLELAAYTDPGGEDCLRRVFGRVDVARVAEGWEHRWRDFHRPVRAGPLWIGPPWERPPAGVRAVVIDPGLAFGTGAHATTRLCLELIAELPRSALLDLGCGSGVLAIAAASLGFTPVTAVDIEPQALAATRRNAAANGVEISVRQVDVLADRLPRAPIVVANLTLAAVEALAGRLRAARTITSGYLVSDRPNVSGFRHRERREREGWAADLWEHSE